jgi:hypothetical protein
LLLLLGLLSAGVAAQAFDHTHGVWTGLLKRHVLLNPEGNASRVNYAGMQADRALLERYLAELSAVERETYAGWRRDRQLAFLINAYNAFTVELILSEYPDLESIKDLGSLFSSPWKRTFFTLLGARRHLDNLEQDMIRAPGVFDEPRIHFALNCASIGCPMLRNEAYVAERLDAQLEDALRRFLTDRERNRFDAASGTLWLSKIFDWYAQDFTGEAAGGTTLKQRFAGYADQLAGSEQARRRLQAGDYRIDYLDYDWRLNQTTDLAGVSDSRSHGR